MNKPWYRLNIDISNAIREDFDFAKLLAESEYADKPLGIWSYTQDEILELLNPEWVSYMATLGIDLTGIMLFYRKPYFISHEAHVDVRKSHGTAIYGINWVFDPEDDSEMIWFDTPADSGRDKTTEVGSLYKAWTITDIADLEISRCCIKNIPTLVSVSIPHNVIVNSKPRWVISLRCPYEDDVLTWEDAIEKFKRLIV